MSKQLSVLLTGVGGGGVGESCMQALRLAETEYRIIATDTSPTSKGIYEADKGYLVPPATDLGYLDRISEICKIENVRAVIPGSEIELYKFADHCKAFETSSGAQLLVNPKRVIDICADKWATHSFLKKHGFAAPKSWLLTGEPSKCLSEVVYPVIIKPVRGAGGSRHSYIAQNEKELSFFISYLQQYGITPLVQEYVGNMDEEYTVGVLIDQGEVLSSFALRRYLKGALSTRFSAKDNKSSAIIGVSTGISQGEVREFPEIRKKCEEIALKLGTNGPLNIQCRLHENELSVFEINPRFSGTTSIRALAGLNEPDILIRKKVLNEKITAPAYKYGVVVRGLENKFISFDLAEKTQKNGMVS